MSLRDAFLAKGLVSKKDADRVARELRDERKASQGQRKSKADEEREARAREEATRAAQLAAAQAAREAHAAALARHEHLYRVRQIILANRLASRGPIPFAFRKPDGFVGVLHLKEMVARDLRNGGAAIVRFHRDSGEPEWVVVTRRAADKLAEVEPEALIHFVRDVGHIGDPSESLMLRTWEHGGLGPHRVRDDAELARLRAREAARPVKGRA